MAFAPERDDPAFLSVKAIARLAGKDESTIRRAVKEGRFPLKPDPTFRSLTFSAAAVRRWLNGEIA